MSHPADAMERCRRLFTRCVINATGCWLAKPQKPTYRVGRKTMKVEYPRVWLPGRRAGVKAHRFVYVTFHGEPPPGTEVAHECGRHNCVNPAHLVAKTPSENNLDRVRHGTHWSTKLTPARVTRLRWLRKWGCNERQLREIEDEVHRSTIMHAVNGTTWPQVTKFPTLAQVLDAFANTGDTARPNARTAPPPA